MSKVINIEDNNYGFDRNKLIGALALKYTSPIVSVPFIAKNESESVIDELCKRTNLEMHDDEIYINGDLITVDMQKSLIIDELVNLAEEDLNNDNNDLYFGSIIKNILKDKMVKHERKDNYLLTEEDLIKGLYGIEEGSKSL